MKKQLADSPFYNKEKELIIYDNKIVLPKLGNRAINFSDVYQIVFGQLDFSLYTSSKKNYFTTIYLRNGEIIELSVPLSGYYALKKYYEKGVKTDGMRETLTPAVLTVGVLLLFFILLYIFVWSR